MSSRVSAWCCCYSLKDDFSCVSRVVIRFCRPTVCKQLNVCRFAPFPKTKMTKLLGDIEDAKALLAKGS